ncbi:hypothetical protein FOZ62_019210, partial [Perkinsus olseni]
VPIGSARDTTGLSAPGSTTTPFETDAPEKNLRAESVASPPPPVSGGGHSTAPHGNEAPGWVEADQQKSPSSLAYQPPVIAGVHSAPPLTRTTLPSPTPPPPPPPHEDGQASSSSFW